MAELIAQGALPGQRWRKRVPPDRPLVIGRQSDPFSAPWDEHISRRHVEVRWTGRELHVRRLPEARNPLFFCGQPADACTLEAGQMFVLGSTSFLLVEESATLAADLPLPEVEQTFTADALRQAHFQDAAHRIEVLARLPDLLDGDISDSELCQRLVTQLLAGVPHADWVAVVAWDPAIPASGATVLHWDSRGGAPVSCAPSERLVRQALQSGGSVVHLWPASATGEGTSAAEITPASSPRSRGAPSAWAFCSPMRPATQPGWAVYVAGQVPAELAPDRRAALLRDDLKFTDLLTDMVGRLRQARRLERRQAALSQFISPTVLEQLGGDDLPGQLSPRECDVSVLFCDLRGFTRTAERAGPQLMPLLDRVSRALGVMTREILATGGVVGDFHGDSAMGFWGWPLEQPDRTARACRAALAICHAFELAAQDPSQSLADFRIGIGVATGRAVAGGIGSSDQVKITVFGPVVNLAARLQELTKVLRAPILVDERTGDLVRTWTEPTAPRIRRLVRVRPRGFESPVCVGQLLPAGPDSRLTNADLAQYETALAAFQEGDFDTALERLHHLPPHDHVKDFLTVYIAQHHRQPPPHWDGVVDFSG